MYGAEKEIPSDRLIQFERGRFHKIICCTACCCQFLGNENTSAAIKRTMPSARWMAQKWIWLTIREIRPGYRVICGSLSKRIDPKRRESERERRMAVVSHRRRRVYFGGLGQYGDKKLAATSLLNCLRYSRRAFFSRISDIRTTAEKRGKSIVPLPCTDDADRVHIQYTLECKLHFSIEWKRGWDAADKMRGQSRSNVSERKINKSSRSVYSRRLQELFILWHKEIVFWKVRICVLPGFCPLADRSSGTAFLWRRRQGSEHLWKPSPALPIDNL